MKTTKTTLQGGDGHSAYLSPLIERLGIRVEAGFAQSSGDANEAGHQLEENDEYSYDL